MILRTRDKDGGLNTLHITAARFEGNTLSVRITGSGSERNIPMSGLSEFSLSEEFSQMSRDTAFHIGLIILGAISAISIWGGSKMLVWM